MLSAVFEILASLGLFLFGMIYLEERIKNVTGRSFKRMLNTATRTNTRALTLGFAATALFQSSSVVSLMTLSFIGAGALSLENGIGIIFGSNLGTTATSWIIAVIGFKLDIKLFAYGVIAIGGIGFVFGDNESKARQYFGGMFGFGLIFLGLEGMKESFSIVSEGFDLTQYRRFSPYFFLLIGLVLTAIIQSSSASIAIAQSALFTQLISFEMAALFVIGANVGTTATVLLGAIGGTSDKKRAATVHLIFNVSTAVLAVLLIAPLTWLTFNIIPSSEPVIALALFHTFFNLLGVVVWFFWIPRLAMILQKRFTKRHVHVTQFIHSVTPTIPVVALESLEHEMRHLSKKVNEFALFAINVVPHQALDKRRAIDKLLNDANTPLNVSYNRLYAQLQELEGEVFNYSTSVSLHISKNQQERLTRVVNIATYLSSASKAIKDMLADFEVLDGIENSDVTRFYHNIRYQILNSVIIFNDYLNGKAENLSAMKKNYMKIDSSYKSTLENVASIAQHTTMNRNITTIAINDVHLTRRFTKNLYHALLAFDEHISKELSALEDEVF